jgi:exosortase A
VTTLAAKWREWSVPSSAVTQGLWRSSLQMLAIAWAGLLLLFWRDAADMALIWWGSSTFNHCLLIIPILVWLVIQRKAELLQLTPQAWWPALVYVAVGAFGWLLGEAAGVAVARQLGLIMMLQGSAAALLGPNVVRGLLFPLFYMFFLLPVGEEAVPALQTLTAKMCMIMLDWAGIPAHIEGIFISTPAGLFRVAEACSGVKFLIAMVALGALVSNLCFTSWRRRIAFMAACVIVPIIANGIRAFATIYMAEFRGIESAAGFDHIFYGWIFFGLVIALVIGGAWKYFDKSADAPAFDPKQLQSPARYVTSIKVVLAGLAVIALLPVAWSAAIASQNVSLPQNNALPKLAGWKRVSAQGGHHWSPRFEAASQILYGRYRNQTGQSVDLYIAIYDKQKEGREVVGFGQGAVAPDSHWSWAENTPAPTNGKAERIIANGLISRDVVSFYRTSGVTSGSGRDIKLATMKTRLFGGNSQAVAILVSAEYQANQSQRGAIDAFIKDLGNIDNLADQLAGVR